MSMLTTYATGPGLPVAIIDRRADQPLPDLFPGAWVESPGAGGLGVIVACNDDEVSVLWSVEPRTLRYDPLSVEEDIYIPVRNVVQKQAPLQDFDNEKDAGWFIEKLNRMLGKKKP